MKSKLYKNEYVISVYDKHDDVITCLDNTAEFARHFNLKVDIASTILSRCFYGFQKHFKFNDEMYQIIFIKECDL